MRSPTAAVIVTVVASVVVFSACDQYGEPAPPPESDMRILRVITGGDDPLFRVSGAVLLPDARVLVAERDDHRVRVFEADGSESVALARRGSGPREVLSPCCLVTLSAGGQVVVSDNGNGRFIVFHTARRADSSFTVPQSVPHGSAEMLPFVVGEEFSDGGWAKYDRLAAHSDWRVTWIHAREGTTRSTSVAVPTWDSTARRTFTSRSGASTSAFAVYPPFSRRTVRHVAPDGRVAQGNSDVYRIEIADPSGRHLRTIDRVSELGPQLSARESDSASRRLAAVAERANLADLGFSVPKRKPPIEGIRFDDAGNLWVQRTVADGERQHVDIYNATGVWTRTLRLPVGVQIFMFPLAHSELLGLRHTEQGEEIVVLSVQP